MEDPHGATRVEIELTPNDASRLRRRKAQSGSGAGVAGGGHDESPDVAPLPPGIEVQAPVFGESPSTVTERRKLVAVAAAVAVVGLLVGWTVGRAGGSPAGEEAQPSATTIAAAPSETLPLAVVPSTAAPVATIPVTTRPRPPSGPTTLPAWQTATVDVDPAVAALGLDIVIVGGRRIVELDTATGELRTLEMSGGISQPPVVDAGPDWFIIRNFDTGVARLVRGDDLPVDAPIPDVWSAHFQADTGTFWQVAREWSPGAPLGVTEVDHEGNPTGRRFEVPGGVWPAAPDPAGGVVVSAAGGIYHVGPDGSQRLTTGNLVSLSPRVAVLTDCGEHFSDCAMYVADRTTGARAEVVPYHPDSGPIDALDVQSPAFWSSPELMGAISPDDRWAPVVLSDDQQQFGLIDLTTGEFVPIGVNPASGWWWSPDSRYAIYNQNSRLLLLDTQQRTTTGVAPPSVAVDAFAVRPAS